MGFRPWVWHLAQQHGIRGRVWNDAAGVQLEAWAAQGSLDAFIAALGQQPPPLARIQAIEIDPLQGSAPPDFQIISSRSGEVSTDIAPDAATCNLCLKDIRAPDNRRHGYAFTNCTHCGPRLSIIRALPYDRANTSMAGFDLCTQCAEEYQNPADRRFHAQPNACPDCGPRLWLEDAQGQPLDTREALIQSASGMQSKAHGAQEVRHIKSIGEPSSTAQRSYAPAQSFKQCFPGEPLALAAELLKAGKLLAIKGIGGFHLACDATNAQAITRLRERKARNAKPLALMAKDLPMLRRYAQVSEAEARLLQSPAAPIVILKAQGEPLPTALAPGQARLGFMLPYSPLHHLLFDRLEVPLVMTSGNRSDEPQCIDNEEARARLGSIADALLLHDRPILNRLDDSLARLALGQPQLLRRARGYTPEPLGLPPGFAQAPRILAMGAELKTSFALLQSGRLILSQHLGDLEDASTLRDYLRQLDLYLRLYEFRPEAIAIDAHPDYLSSQHGQRLAGQWNIPLLRIGHHHAHIAAVMLEHGLPLDTAPLLGIALDGLGLGKGEGGQSELWGGELLLVNYQSHKRLGRLRPIALPGGARAMREPWRNTLAHLLDCFEPEEVQRLCAPHGPLSQLGDKPLALVAQMLERGLNAPLASSAGRLFDAVAAALGCCVDEVGYEGQAGIELEALAQPWMETQEAHAYPVTLDMTEGLLELGWLPLWQGLLADMGAGLAPGIMAARFHWALIHALAEAASQLCQQQQLSRVVLSGGVMQNLILLEGLASRLEQAGLEVLIPRRYPANDGGLSLGQAAIAAASVLEKH